MLLVNAVSRELSGLLTAVPIATEYSGEDPVSWEVLLWMACQYRGVLELISREYLILDVSIG
jgi:hypothetical protein